MNSNELGVSLIPGGITAPKGFAATGVSSGIRKKGTLDLALIRADVPCKAVGVFTTNRVKAHPVMDSMKKLPSKHGIQAVLINSGCANACTGPEGLSDLKTILTSLSKETGIPEDSQLMSSTGVIGERLPVQKIVAALPDMVASLSRQGHEKAARAIMTTDTKLKEIAVSILTDRGIVTIGGMAKGAGMINPCMATMLAFLTTDALITNTRNFKRALKQAVDKSFNKIDLDGDTSTNDSVIMLASGLSGIGILGGATFDDMDSKKFCDALETVCSELARMIAIDTEGSTKFISVTVRGAANKRQAEAAARTVAESSLVKTAIYGQDPNWGRIMAALGRSGATFQPDLTSIGFNGLEIVRHGRKNSLVTEKEARSRLSSKEIHIAIDLHGGKEECTILTGDLTEEYVRINASYRS